MVNNCVCVNWNSRATIAVPTIFAVTIVPIPNTGCPPASQYKANNFTGASATAGTPNSANAPIGGTPRNHASTARKTGSFPNSASTPDNRHNASSTTKITPATTNSG